VTVVRSRAQRDKENNFDPVLAFDPDKNLFFNDPYDNALFPALLG